MLSVRAAFRRLKNNPLYTLITVTGLAAGLACFLLITIYVHDELSFDRFFTNAGRICRVTLKTDLSSTYRVHFARCPFEWVRQIVDEYPEVTALARFHQAESVVRYGGKKFREEKFFVTDPDVFSVLDYPFLSGDPVTALLEPRSLVLTETAAKKYFGETDPAGKTVEVINHFTLEKQPFTVTGVLRDLPPQTHFHFSMLASYGPDRKPLVNEWNYIYIQLDETADRAALEVKLPAFVEKHTNPAQAEVSKLILQPLTDIHLRSDIDRELEPNGDIDTVRLFLLLGAMILLIVTVNSVNLTTAQQVVRRKELGIRRLLGAGRTDRLRGFLAESALTAFPAVPVSIGCAVALLPLFNHISGKTLDAGALAEPAVLAVFLAAGLCAVVITGVMNGLVSTGKPADMLRSGAPPPSGRAVLRDALVVFQFAVSAALIVCASVMYLQINHLHTRDMGLDTANVAAIPRIHYTVQRGYDRFREALLRNPLIADAAGAMEPLSREILDAGHIQAEGVEQDPENPALIYASPVTYNYIDMLDIELAAGRNFRKDSDWDEQHAYILNETAVRALGWPSPEEAVGKRFTWRELDDGEVIGVVRDFNQSTMKKPVKPLVLFLERKWMLCILIKTVDGAGQEAQRFIHETWDDLFPDQPLDMYYADDLYAALYNGDRRVADVVAAFAVLAVLLACLGLFGLVSYAAERRTKEIGIRKTLGASRRGLVWLLSRGFLIKVLIANLIAMPAAWYAADVFLRNYAYRISVNPLLFAGTVLLTLAVAFLTVSARTLNAARIDPADTLRHE